MICARTLALALALTIAPCAVADDTTPLLAYANRQSFPPVVDQGTLKRKLDQITYVISRDPPPETNCAHTLGARRFASMFDELGAAYSSLGRSVDAAESFAKAVNCNPRAPYLRAQLASELLHLGRYEQARAEAGRQMEPGLNNFALHSLLAQVDFSQEQWPLAIEQLRMAVNDAPDDLQATYWQCFLWLAQMRAGVSAPVLASRPPSALWPRPILEFLQDRITETALVQAVAAEQDGRRRHEILSEALFYTGEKYLATHRTAEARRYFAATVHLEVLYYIEHYLAKAELGKLMG